MHSKHSTCMFSGQELDGIAYMGDGVGGVARF